MVTFDARPSAFTPLTATSEWEYLMGSAGIRDGVDQVSSLVPSLDSGGRNAVISAGNCIIKGMLWRCDASVSTAIPAASASNRIDRLVLRLNRGASSSPTVIQPVIITGTPSGSPVEPPLSQTVAGNWDIPICSWTSNSNGTLSGLLDERQFTGVVRDTWHDMRPLGNGWVGSIGGQMPPQYRFSDDYKWVEVTGVISNPTSAIWTGKAFKTLPVAYRPAIGDRWPCSGASLNPSPYYPYAPVIQAWSNGNLTLELCDKQNLEANGLIGITGRFALNASGLILSLEWSVMTGRIPKWVPNVVIGAAIGAVVASVFISLIITFHPLNKIPENWKTVLSGLITGAFSIIGGAIEHWRSERTAAKAADKAVRKAIQEAREERQKDE